MAVFLPDTPSGSEDKEREDALAALEADVNQRLLPGEEAILLSQQNQAVLLLSSAAKTDDALTPLLMDCLPSISQAYSSPLRFCCSGFVQDPSPHAAYTRRSSPRPFCILQTRRNRPRQTPPTRVECG